MGNNYVVQTGSRAASVRDSKSRPTVRSMGKPTMNIKDPRNIGKGC